MELKSTVRLEQRFLRKSSNVFEKLCSAVKKHWALYQSSVDLLIINGLKCPDKV